MSTMAQSNATSDAPDDAELQLKKRARRRLVGAIALVLFAVIVLPMVMDHEPRSVAPEIQVRIPNQDGSGFVGRIAPGKVVKPTPLPPPVSDSVKPGESIKPPLALKDNVAPPVPEAKAPIKPDLKPDVMPEAAKQAASPPLVKSSEKPTQAPAKSADEVRAAAVLAGGEVAASGQWIVQLGAYKELGNVKLLSAKIKEMGLPVYSEKFDSPQGAQTRVRAGPFASREAAEKAQSRIKKIINVDGSVAAK